MSTLVSTSNKKGYTPIKVVLAFLLLFLSISAFGKEKTWSAQLIGNQIIENSSITINDPETLGSGIVTQSRKSFLELKIDDYSSPFYWYECAIHVQIIPILFDGNNGVSYEIDLKVQNNHYGNFGAFYDLNKHGVIGAEKGFIVNVISINVLNKDTGLNENSVPDNVSLTASMEVERYYDISNITSPSLNAVTDANNSLHIFWNEIPEAEIYELEWTWVDSYGINLADFLTPSQIPFTLREFELNNTRIQTKNNYYDIPLLFDRGYIVYRLRPVGVFLTNVSKKFEGVWSFNAAITTLNQWPDRYDVSTSNNMNWQFQASYAELGKKKEVVSYFDGSLRNRQTVTKINSNNKVIVGEVIYDEEGRPAVEVLPAPSEEAEIKYYADFNKNSFGDVYSYQDLKDINNTCNELNVGMSENSGASKYYSQNNSIVNNYQDFVPIANKYPFSKTEYSSDNTGRIKRKGGVGIEHQIGGNHEMKYYYSVPSQEELNRLFGLSVGNASHYKKNFVIDPNGQKSVSYIDPQGRTIATALSDRTPDNLVGLEGYHGEGDIHIDLLNKLNLEATDTDLDNNIKIYSGSFANNFYDGLKFEAQKVLTNPSVEYKFSYDLIKNKPFSINCGQQQYNYPFIYRLNINSSSECDQNLVTTAMLNLHGSNETYFDQNSQSIIIGNYNTHTIADDPNTENIDETGIEVDLVTPNHTTIFNPNPNIEDTPTFTINGVMGNIGLNKKLMVDQDALEIFANDYIKKGLRDGCILSPQSPSVDTISCYFDCVSCENHYRNLEFSQNGQNYIGKDAYIHKMLSTNAQLLSLDEQSQDYADLLVLLTVRYGREWDLLIEECQEMCETISNSSINGSSISCDNNLDDLINDMLPDGQYGIYSTLIDIEGNASMENSDESISDLVANNYFTVYNDNQTFNKIFAVAPGINPQTPDWRHPVYFDNDNVISTNYPSSINDGANSDIFKHYFDETGHIDYVKVIIDPDTNEYDPRILETAIQDHLITVDSDAHIYKIEPQYLKNVEDFISQIETKRSWALSLIKYHPEFHYLDYKKEMCQKTLTINNAFNLDDDEDNDTITYNSDGFDAFVGNFSTFNEALEAGLLANDYTLFNNDPYFQLTSDMEGNRYRTNSSNPTIVINNVSPNDIDINKQMLQAKRAIMAQALFKSNAPMTTENGSINLGQEPFINLNNPAVVDEGFFWNVTIPEHDLGYNGTQRKLIEQIYYMTFCNVPGGEANPQIPSSFENIISAVNSPNVSVDDKDRFWRNYLVYYTGLKQRIQTVFSNVYATRQGFYNYTIGRSNSQHYNRIWNLIRDYPSVRAKVKNWIQGNYPNHTLDTENRNEVIDKEKRFIPYDMKFDSDKSPQEIADEIINNANLEIYQSTGQCPGVRDLQIFLDSGAKKVDMFPIFSGTNDNNTPQPHINYITPYLLNAMGGDYSQPLNLSGNVSGNTLTMNFTQPSPLQLENITLTLPTGAANPNNLSWNTYGTSWSISQIHNTTYINYDTNTDNSAFTCIATIVPVQPGVTFGGDSQYTFTEIIINGTIGIPLACGTNLNAGATIDDNGNPSQLYLDGSNAANCDKKEKFSQALLELINNIKANTNINTSTSYLIPQNTIPSYIKLFMGINPNDIVYWKHGFNSSSNRHTYALYINPQNQTYFNIGGSYSQCMDVMSLIDPISVGGDCERLLIGSPTNTEYSINFASGNITNLSIGEPIINQGMTGHYGHYFFKVSIEDAVTGISSNFQSFLAGRHNSSSDNANKGLAFRFTCCESCGEWDFDGDYVIDNGDFYNTSCDSHDDTRSQATDIKDFDLDTIADINDTNQDYGMCFNDTNHIIDLFQDKLEAAINAILNISPTVTGYSEIVSIPAVEQLSTSNLSSGSTTITLNNLFAKNFEDINLVNEAVNLSYFRYYKENNFPKIFSWMNTNGVDNTTTFYEIYFDLGNIFQHNVATINNIIIQPATDPYTETKNQVKIIGTYEGGEPFEVFCSMSTNRYKVGKLRKPMNICRFLRLKDDLRITQKFECDCVPQTPKSYSADAMFTLYEAKRLNPSYQDLHLTQYTLQEFFNKNFQFITEGYLYYLTTFNITNTSHPYYLTLAQFGATALNYGFNDVNNTGYNDVIDGFHSSTINNSQLLVTLQNGTTVPVNSWSRYAMYYLQTHPAICPPAFMTPLTIDEVKMENPCVEFKLSVAETYNAEIYNQYIASKKEEFKRRYLEEAINEVVENFNMFYNENEYHYTLYYYDQAGNLIQTVAPQGLNRLELDSSLNYHVNAARNNDEYDSNLLPNHLFKTKYKYNSLNQLVWQSTPDGGETRFAYDPLGRIVASQNDKQKNTNPNINHSLNLQTLLSQESLTVSSIANSIGWDDVRGHSIQTINSYSYVEHTINTSEPYSSDSSNGVKFGLSYSNTNLSNDSLDYGFSYDGTNASIIINNVIDNSVLFPYANGDKFRIERAGEQIKFFQNGTLLLSLNILKDDMYVDFGISSPGSIIYDIKFGNFLAPSFSYTCYDALGRIKEAGQFNCKEYLFIDDEGRLRLPDGVLALVDANHDDYPHNYSENQIEVTKTLYDNYSPFDPSEFLSPKPIRNSRNRVTAILTFGHTNESTHLSENETAIFYDYDIHGNVDEMSQRISPSILHVQGYPNGIIKNVKYQYDLISGNVNKVIYQDNAQDLFIHKYNYDADNRITSVETSSDGVIWEKDASYEYYEHGPLARVITGDKKVQGTDYAYTLQGWLKTVNSENLSSSNKDMGKDGSHVSKDAYGYSLSYFDNDYLARNPGDNEAHYLSTTSALTGNALYNGNINRMITSVRGLNEEIKPTQVNLYSYDQLNRIFSMESNAVTQDGTTLDIKSSYGSNYNYDKNGNLITLKRSAPISEVSNMTQEMDSFEYNYLPQTNKLTYIKDSIDSQNFNTDIDDQNPGNYQYDEIGQLIQDEAEGIHEINWRVDGKVKSILKGGRSINFFYDGLGNRVLKKYSTERSGTVSTHYTRDAQGNTMAVYEMKINREGDGKYKLAEHHIYGSSRLGVQEYGDFNKPSYFYRIVGDKKYELSNHLGNVLNVISDRKIVDSHVELLERDYFDDINNNGWNPYNQSSLTTLAGSLLVYPSDLLLPSGVQRKIDLKENHNYTLQLLVTRLSTFPTNIPIIAQIKQQDGTVLWSTSVPESGVLSGNFTSPNVLGGVTCHLIITAMNPNKNENVKFELDNYYLYRTETSNSDFVSLYLPDVLAYNDYYPFGSLVPNRYGSIDSYRYGFQGQEKDDEIKGEGNSLNYTFRMHDPRVGRFFAVDPLTYKYPFYSPYHFSSNSPIVAVELEGLESSKKINENEKSSSFREKLARGLLLMVEGFINIGRITQFKPPLQHPILQASPQENLESVKSVYNTTFEVGSIWQTAKYGIGGEDDELNIFRTTFKTASAENETVVSSMSLTQKISTRINFVTKKYSSLIEKYGKESIDFTNPVYEQKMSGTGLKTKRLVQWREPGNNRPSPFFTFEGEDPSTLGIPKTYTQKYNVELAGENTFLRSTANTIEAFSPEKDPGVSGKYLGGGTQLYSEEAAKTAKFIPAN